MPITVLLIDDDKRVLHSFARNVRLAGYTVIMADSGIAGLELYRQEQPDIVLTDLRMPGINGLEVLRTIRQHDPEANVILVSGHGNQDAILEALRAGAADFLSKPVDQVALESALRRAAERVHLTRELRASQEALRRQNAQLEAEVAARTAALRERERDLIQAQRVAHVGSWQIDLTTGRVIASEEAQRIYGLDGVEWVLATVQSIPLPEYREMLDEVLEGLIQRGEPYDIEFRIRRHSDGEIRVIHSVAEHDPERHRVIGVIQDITERKYTETVLRQTMQRFQSLLDHSPVLMHIFDEAGRYLLVGEATAKILGVPREEIIGKTFADLLSPEAAATFMRRVEALKEANAALSVDDQITVNGEARFFESLLFPLSDEDGVAIYAAIATDITERKRMENTMRLHSLVLNQIQDLVTVTDLEGVITYINQAEVATMGRTREEIVGQSTVIYGEDAARGATQRDIIAKTLQDGSWRGEVINFVPDGSERVMDCRTQVVYDEREQPIALCGISTDITDRKRMEAALRSSEARFRSYVEHAPYGLFIADEQGRYVEVNPAACAITGYTEEELLRMSILDLLPPQAQKIGSEHFQQVMEIGQATGNGVPFLHKSGEIRYWKVDAVRLSPTRLMGYVQDVTAQREAEALTQHWQELLEFVIKHDPNAIAVLDTDLHFKFVSDRFVKDYRAEDRDIIGRHHYEVFPEVPEKWRAIHQRALQGEVMRAEEDHFTRPDGTVDWTRWECRPWYRVEGAIGGIILYTEVITDRKETEEALRESERQFRAWVDGAPDAIFVQTEHRFAYTNPAALRLFGAEIAALLMGQPVIERFHPSVRDRVRQRIHTLNEDKRQVPMLEEVYLRLDGSPVDVEVAAVPINYEGKDGALVFVRDITERKQAEAQLQEYAERLEQMVEEKVRQLDQERTKVIQLDKMASVGQLATSIAHELKQPLTSIAFDAEYLKRLIQQNQATALNHAELKRIGTALEADVARCRRIIDHLRTFGRVTEDNISPINLNQPLEDSLIVMGAQLRSDNIDIHIDLAASLPLILANSHRLEQVFLNLIANAEYAMQEAAERDGREKTLTLHTRRDGDWVVAEVRDNGCGMPEEVQARLFEPFFTTKPAGKGTGLGLPICYDIVVGAGGEIACQSTVGEGTAFILRFPVAE